MAFVSVTHPWRKPLTQQKVYMACMLCACCSANQPLAHHYQYDEAQVHLPCICRGAAAHSECVHPPHKTEAALVLSLLPALAGTA